MKDPEDSEVLLAAISAAQYLLAYAEQTVRHLETLKYRLIDVPAALGAAQTPSVPTEDEGVDEERGDQYV